MIPHAHTHPLPNGFILEWTAVVQLIKRRIIYLLDLDEYGPQRLPPILPGLHQDRGHGGFPSDSIQSFYLMSPFS